MESTNLLMSICAVVVSVSGCATITRGSSEEVEFVSDPPGAQVVTSLGPGCTTPCTIEFGRRDTFDAVFTLGEQEQTVSVDTAVEGGGAAGLIGNALIGGVIGVGIDAASGAAFNHVPNPVRVTFAPVGPVAEGAERTAGQGVPDAAAPAGAAPAGGVTGAMEPGESVPAIAGTAATGPTGTGSTEIRDDGFRWEIEPPAS